MILDLTVTQDSVGDLVPSGQGGFIPSIDTTEITTQVLVGNGETVVLGGVFRTEDLDTVGNQGSLLWRYPLRGRIVHAVSRRYNTKTETLIFITPRILADTLLD